jgi:hypothetical protein
MERPKKPIEDDLDLDYIYGSEHKIMRDYVEALEAYCDNLEIIIGVLMAESTEDPMKWYEDGFKDAQTKCE